MLVFRYLLKVYWLVLASLIGSMVVLTEIIVDIMGGLMYILVRIICKMTLDVLLSLKI